ncbi:DEAD/DEAH box helicase [Streptomyces sp. NRRL F-5135]|uniref:DEAD/DEAH box helicase n=1 Tax=Streptomyces sp. NRRL F-5135 TaxID=1463858 RepID=UPI000A8795E3|nr:DEAD/DEAH box helicase [Streptomyces sp. NRRL F-5135]
MPEPAGTRTATADRQLGLAPGTQIEVRDEEWLVRNCARVGDSDDYIIEATGVSELVRDQEACFLTSLDQYTVLSPEHTRLVPDTSHEFRQGRLFLEAVLRKTPLPQAERGLALTDGFLLDRMDYQLRPAEKALANPLRPRLLIGDVVGLGKTLEIGILLGELIRRGRGERILVVTPAPVLEQFQHELWTRFSLPLVRLDSIGISRIERNIPVGRNPFTYYKRVIVSMDTIKNPKRYKAWLDGVRWDAVVIDESHSLIGESSDRRALANLLAERTDALILASATPHNGKMRSFAGLVSLLDPTAIKDMDRPRAEELEPLCIRRTKTSREVAGALHGEWAPRGDSYPLPCAATELEERVFEEFASFWLRRPGDAGGVRPAASVGDDRLFPYVLLKSFLSSHRALYATVRQRLRKRGHALPQDIAEYTDAFPAPAAAPATPGTASPAPALPRTTHPGAALPAAATTPGTVSPETASLLRLAGLAARLERAVAAHGPGAASKLAGLVAELERIGVGAGKDTRAVVFSERRETLNWLAVVLPPLLGWRTSDAAEDAVKVLHSDVSDTVQMDYVDEFARRGGSVRLLLTGDGASEGVNLHRQCHHLIHWDLPWSLIRVEQRNGRIDRYGQRNPPEFRALILTSAAEGAMDDTDVAQRVLERESVVHEILGTVEATTVSHDADQEEERLMKALLTGTPPEEAVRALETVPASPAAGGTAEVPVEQALMGEFGTYGFGAAGPGPGGPDRTGADGDGADDGLDLLAFLDEAPEPEAVAPGPAEDPALPPPPLLADELRLFSSTREYVLTALRELRDLESFRLDTVVDGTDLSFDTPADLKARLAVLPASYRREQGIDRRLNLTFSRTDGADALRRAREDADSGSLWPDAHYVGELHPVVEWITDKVLVQLGRQNAPVLQVDGDNVPDPVFLVQGVWSNAEGRPTIVAWLAVDRLGPGGVPRVRRLTRDLLAELGVGPGMTDEGRGGDVSALQTLVPSAVDAALRELDRLREENEAELNAPLTAVEERVERWKHETLPGMRAGGKDAVDENARRLADLARRLKTVGAPMVRVLAVLEPGA